MKKLYAKIFLVFSTIFNTSFAESNYVRNFSSDLLNVVNEKYSHNIQSEEELSDFIKTLSKDELDKIAMILEVETQDVLGNGAANLEGVIQ